MNLSLYYIKVYVITIYSCLDEMPTYHTAFTEAKANSLAKRKIRELAKSQSRDEATTSEINQCITDLEITYTIHLTYALNKGMACVVSEKDLD